MNFTDANGYVVSFWIYRYVTRDAPEGFKVYASDCDTIGPNAVELGHYSCNYDIAYPVVEPTSGWYQYETDAITMTVSVYIIFEGQSYNGSPTYVDDIEIKVAPSCHKPTGLDADADADATSAELSWTANSGETDWTLYWKESGATDYTEVANATNPYTLSGLTAATNYQYYVVANCSADDASEASELFPFTTACYMTPALGFSENFDSYTAGNNVLPTCWNYINTTTNSTYVVYPRVYANSYSTYANSAPNCLYLYSYYSTWTDYDPQPQYAILPEMTGLVGLQITLYAKGYTASSTFKIGTMSDPTDASTFTMIAEQALTTSYPTDPFEYLIPADCRDSYLAIMMDAAPSGSNTRGVYVDDIVISEVPTCIKPTNLEATANALTATITWVSEAGEYEVAYSTDNTANPDENIAGTATEETYTMNGLALGDHYFWVRANCGSNGYSEWAGPVSAHIGYCVPNPTSHDGSGITGVSFGMGNYVVENGGEGTSIPASAPYYGDYSNMIGAVQASVESTIAITTGTGSYPYTFVIWVDFDNSLSFEDSEVVYVGKASSGAGTFEATITVPATQATGDYRMRIYGADSYFNSFYGNGTTNWQADHDPCSSGTYRHANDYTLRVLEAPSCMMPTNVAVNYTGGTTATVTWEGTAETYNIDVNGTVINDVTTPYTLTGLEMATTYAVMIQANCDNDVTSEWTVAVSFTTDPCMPEDQCEITFELTDSYGDGWNGGAGIQVIDVETNAEIGFMTNEDLDGESGYGNSELNTLTLAVCDGREIQFVWVSGNFDNECSYVVKNANGEVIFSGKKAMTEPVNYTMNCPAAQTFDLTIGAHSAEGEDMSGWHLIASPLYYSISVDAVDHMTDNQFDLYRFNQAPAAPDYKEWKNYKSHTEGFLIESGIGYLYANSGDVTLTFTGEPYNSEYDKSIELSKTDNNPDESMRGWNLVGNPYTVKAYPRRDFYVMNPDGNDIVTPERNYIEPMEGAFVYAEQNGELFTFYKTPENSNDNKGALSINVMEAANHRGNRLIDRAVVRFGEGNVLPKFMLNENHTKVYIPQDNKEFAIVSSEGQGEMPLSFRANENGTYTLSFNAEEVSFSYLHLIDNMTGMDVDLLAATSTGSVATYTFDARTTDYSSRFKLVFATGSNNDSDNFAFFSNGTWVIGNDGEATLQVIDVTGRVLSSETVNDSVSKAINASAGVYMLRLINGNDVKTQKIVVR